MQKERERYGSQVARGISTTCSFWLILIYNFIRLNQSHTNKVKKSYWINFVLVEIEKSLNTELQLALRLALVYDDELRSTIIKIELESSSKTIKNSSIKFPRVGWKGKN